MSSYLSYKFIDTPGFINTFDELPLWSASFGLLLLKNLEYRPGLTIVDVGSGAGFPLMEIASRFGATCTCYGVDPWHNANTRARQKIQDYRLTNVEIIEASADKIPLLDSSVDLVVSNLGINNFDDPPAVFAECYRILKPGGKLSITTNLDGHWQEFYDVFEQALRALNKNEAADRLVAHCRHRGTEDSISSLFSQAGFQVSKTLTESFEMKFTDGGSFLDHHFVKLGWLSSWIAIVDDNDLELVFNTVQHNLDMLAAEKGGLTLTVPMAYIEGKK